MLLEQAKDRSRQKTLGDLIKILYRGAILELAQRRGLQFY